MIKRFNPIQDAFIFGKVSGSVTQTGSLGDNINTGLDEILELGCYDKSENLCSRMLVKFSDEAISLASASIAAQDDCKVFLHMYLAEAESLPVGLNISCHTLQQSWEEGLFKSYDTPSEVNGATWKYRTVQDVWTTPGGTYSPSGSVATLTKPSYGREDLQIDITDRVSELVSQNNGLLIKLENENYDANGLGAVLKYFSSDTHTIYKPFLEINYDDSEQDSELQELSDEFHVKLSNLKQTYSDVDKVKLRLSVCPSFPKRVFTTHSLYESRNILPENSYWGIKDEYSGDMIVDFSEGTKISADDEGSFFILDTSLLEPERYYRILLKVVSEGTETVVNTQSVFKVVSNGRD